MIIFVAALFTVKFYLARRKIARAIYNSPSVVFLGAGEEAIKHIHGQVSHHKGIHYARHAKGILVAPHHREVRKMNAKKIVYVFDSSRPAKSQVKEFNARKKSFGKITAASFGKAPVRAHNLNSDPDLDKLKSLIDQALSAV